MSLKIHKTYKTDFELIYPILLLFDSPHKKNDWVKIFNYKWNPKDYVGYHLTNESNEIVGFMGLIFSTRIINGKTNKFCNVTSFIIKDGYRAFVTLFLLKLKNLDDYILTGLSPIRESYNLFKKIGFKILEEEYIIIPTINKITRNRGKYSFSNKETRNRSYLKILKDHKNLNCNYLILNIDGKECILIFRVVSQIHFGILIKKILIFHINDVELFNETISIVLNEYYIRYGLFSVIYVDRRFLQKKIRISFKRKLTVPRIFKYNNKIDPRIIDELYSEHILL